MKFLILLSVCLVYMTKALDQQGSKLSEEQPPADHLTSSLDMLRTFKGLLPEDLKKAIESLNLSERGEVINFLSDLYHGRVRMPENKDEIIQLIKRKLPTVYEKIDALNSSVYEKFARIRPEARNTQP